MRLSIQFLDEEVLFGIHVIEEITKNEIDWYAYIKIKSSEYQETA